MDKRLLTNLDLIQMSAVEKLSRLKAGALFMEMGTGKTRVAVQLIQSKVHYIDIVIWIAPASLLSEESYKKEIKKWAGEDFHLFRFYTIEGVSQSDIRFIELLNTAENNRCFCVIDESIKIKNIDSKRTNRLLKNYSKFDFRLILNGTPTTKNLVDLLPQINFISPHILNMNETQFANNFLEYFTDGYRGWRRWSKPANEEALIEIIRPYIFDSKLDLDVEVKIHEKKFDMNSDEISEYQDTKNDYFSKVGCIDFLAMTQKFQQLYTVNDNKYANIINIINSNNAEQFIIFVKYLHEVDILLEQLSNSREFTGRSKASIDDFKSNKFRVLICTYGTGAFGLNLQFCHNIIFASQTFDYKDKIQALHRVVRTGQKNTVKVYDLYVNVGLENIIRSSLEKKENTLDNLKRIIEKKGVEAL